MDNQSNTGAIIDVTATQVADNPSIPLAKAVEMVNMERQVAVFDPVKAALAELSAIIEGTVYDINTASGEATAKDLRSKFVKLRTRTADLYAEYNAPLLEAGRRMRAVTAEIVAGIKPHETKLDTEIKAREKVREDERLRKVAIEEARIKALREKINAIAALPAQAVLLNAAGISAECERLTHLILDESSFAEFAEEAEGLRQYILAQLENLFKAAELREAETEHNRIESLRLDAERQRMQDEAAAAIAEAKKITDAAAESARLLLESAAAERQRQEAENAERQHQADLAHSKQVADLKRQQDAFEEERRIARAEDAERAATLAAQRKVIEDQFAKMNPAPVVVADPVVVDEKPAPAPVDIAPAAIKLVAKPVLMMMPEEVAAAEARADVMQLIEVVCLSFNETEEQAIKRLLSNHTKNALIERMYEIDGSTNELELAA
jgi:hypothetical protein